MDRSKESDFNSPSKGKINFNTLISELLDFINENPQDQYHLIVGTSSQASNDDRKINFVTAIVIHRVGKGARYFWRRNTIKQTKSLYPPAIKETFSLTTARKLLEKIDQYIQKDPPLPKYKLEIHIDIGQKGSTDTVIQEIVGTLKDSGLNIKTGQNGHVADKAAAKHKKIPPRDRSEKFCRACGSRQDLTKHHYFRKPLRKDTTRRTSEFVRKLCEVYQIEPDDLVKIVLPLCKDCHASIEKMIDEYAQAAGRSCNKLSIEHYMLINLIFLGIDSKKKKTAKKNKKG